MSQMSGAGDAIPPRPGRHVQSPGQGDWHGSASHTAPASTPVPEYCPDCTAVCGSTFQGALCGCDGCPHCAELAHIALEKWLGTTINPQGGAL